MNEEDGYDLTSIPPFYRIVPHVCHLKKPLNPKVITFQGTVDGSAEVFKETLIEEYR